jgi:hypothetical protein
MPVPAQLPTRSSCGLVIVGKEPQDDPRDREERLDHLPQVRVLLAHWGLSLAVPSATRVHFLVHHTSSDLSHRDLSAPCREIPSARLWRAVAA